MLLCATGGDVVDLKAFGFLEIWTKNFRQFLDRILGDRKSAAMCGALVRESPDKHQSVFGNGLIGYSYIVFNFFWVKQKVERCPVMPNIKFLLWLKV